MNIYIAIPAMNESEYILNTINCILNQKTTSKIKIYVCINQPESYWNDIEKRKICYDNEKTNTLLERLKLINLIIIDKFSKGNGWNNKNFGVGEARKTLMDIVSEQSSNDDIILSLDADTTFDENYLESIYTNFLENKNISAISVPYYHKLTNDELLNKLILRYEIYMRNYAIQLHKINSPYSFTALGSAMAIKNLSYKAIRGIAPVKSGEDFYFIQKLLKYKTLSIYNKSKVFPSARLSDRVFFGTGPALIKGASNNWDSYPIYHESIFDEIDKAYKNLILLFANEIENQFIDFLKEHFRNNNFLVPLRNNFKIYNKFVRAFHTKADGLRILQFCKLQQSKIQLSENDILFHNYNYLNNIIKKDCNVKNLTDYSVQQLTEIREYLVVEEDNFIKQKQFLEL